MVDIVRIKSIDMAYNAGAWSKKDIVSSFGLVKLNTVGWLVEERDECIIIASEYQPDEEQYRHIFAIPRVCIEEIQKLRKV